MEKEPRLEPYNFIDTLTLKEIEIAKDPGLNIKYLHELGFTGKGVGVAVIDHPLILDYRNVKEYGDRIVHYEGGVNGNSVHGPAVASMLVGKECGVAPECDIYYFTRDPEVHPIDEEGNYTRELEAEQIRRVIEFNKTLPDDKKIRAISLTVGWKKTKNTEDIEKACEEAKQNGIFILTTSAYRHYDLNPISARCELDKDRNDPTNYELSTYLSSDKNLVSDKENKFKNGIMVPVDCRVYANSLGNNGFAYDKNGAGGMSWSVPFITGIYAMVCQIKPDITPENFVRIMNETGSNVELSIDERKIDLKVLNPVGIVNAILSEIGKEQI